MREFLFVFGSLTLFGFNASAAAPAMALQSAQPITDPGAFLLIGFGLLAVGALGVRKYKKN